MRGKLVDLYTRAKDRPDGYLESFLDAGVIIEGEIDIPDEEFEKLRERWAPADGPTIPEMFANFTRATARWVAAGFPIVSEDVLRRRLGPEGCGTCEFFDPSARGKRGKCNHPLCGCTTSWKAELQTEKCPINRPGWQ